MKIGITLLAALMLTIACRKKPTTWNADYSVPLINDTLDIADLRFDTLFSVDQNGNYALNYADDLYDLNLANFVTIPDTFIESTFNLNFTTSVPAGFEFINQTEENDLGLNPVLLKKVFVKKGSFDVEISNPHETKIFYTITFPDVLKNGQVYSVQLSAPAGSIANPSVVTTSIDLENTQITLSGGNGDQSNILRTVFGVKSDPNGPDITATSSHVTLFKTALRNIVLDYARGYFGQQQVEDTFSLELDFLKRIKSGLIDFPNTTLNLVLTNGAKVNGRVNLMEVKSFDRFGNAVSLAHPKIGVDQNVNACVGSYGNYTPFELSYVFTFMNSNLEAFLENGMDRIFIRYAYEINPNGNVSGSYDEAFSTSLLKLSLKATMPLKIGLDELVYQDTFDLNTQNIVNQLDRIQEVSLLVNGKNSYEIDGLLSFTFLNAQKEILFVKEDAIRLSAPVAGVTNADGLNESRFSESLFFSKEELMKLKEGAFLVPELKLSTYGAGTSSVSPTQLNIYQKLILNLSIQGTYQNELD